MAATTTKAMVLFYVGIYFINTGRRGLHLARDYFFVQLFFKITCLAIAADCLARRNSYAEKPVCTSTTLLFNYNFIP